MVMTNRKWLAPLMMATVFAGWTFSAVAQPTEVRLIVGHADCGGFTYWQTQTAYCKRQRLIHGLRLRNIRRYHEYPIGRQVPPDVDEKGRDAARNRWKIICPEYRYGHCLLLFTDRKPNIFVHKPYLICHSGGKPDELSGEQSAGQSTGCPADTLDHRPLLRYFITMLFGQFDHPLRIPDRAERGLSAIADKLAE